MKAKINDKIKTLVMVEGIPKERIIPVGSIGVVIEAYESPEAEGYAVDFALPDNSLVGDFAYANAYLEPDQFEVINGHMENPKTREGTGNAIENINSQVVRATDIQKERKLTA